MVSTGTVIAVVVAVTVLVSIAVINRSHRLDRGWGDVLRSRLLFGVPWGTLVVVLFVLAVYLVVQDGITDFDDPVTVPYRAWSYFYPLGMLTAPLSHAGPGHLTGNLIGTVVVAPIAEYAWGHYPNGREAEAGDSWRTHPWLRAFVFFPLVAIGIALVTSLFALGPVIGFSGVVFAFVGFAIVHYPIATILGVLGVQGALGTIYRAIQNPIVVYVPQASPPGPPSWATIAIQGHALGLFIGLVLGVLLLRRRRTQPNVFHVWLAVLLYGFSSSLWAIYWFGGQNTYILFRGYGVILVTVLSLLVALAVAGPETPIVPRRFRQFVGRPRPSIDRVLELGCRDTDTQTANTGERPVDRLDRITAISSSRTETELQLDDLTPRTVGILVVFMTLAVLAGGAVPINVLVLEESVLASESSIEIDDYTITYAENVENELTSGIPVEQLASDLESSGVIVTSEDREIWYEAISTRRLAFSGSETVHVGGPGWRAAVHADRTGWTPIGNDTVYQVHLAEDGDDGNLAYESNSSQADVALADRNVTVASADGEFQLEVDDGATTSTAEIPTSNETTTAGGVTFERDDRTVYGSIDGTELRVARQEQYS